MAPGARRVISQYTEPGAGSKAYLRLRWAVCPFDRLLPFIPREGRLLDVGCGSGLWLTYLALERPGLVLHGIDADARKLALAAKSKIGKPVLRQAGADDLPEGTFDCITILDVLYVLPDEVKATVLQGCHRALSAGGTIVVKELDTRPRWKFAPAALEELVAVRAVKLTHGGGLHFQSLDDLSRTMGAAGFVGVEATRIDRGYLHPHVVVCALKPRPT
jgi:2-polyprenyl-3-methyl-5-hydroxy-6-metoxy-1,4-benzoquinol methylase